MRKEKLIIFSAPSGSGKSTVVRHLLGVFPSLAFSISATTRKPRKGEKDGKDYYYLSEKEFEKKIKAGDFLEYEQVYKGLYYGTLKSELNRLWNNNKVAIFDVDVIGGLNIKKQYPENTQSLAVFIKAPSIDELKIRLKNRSTEVEHQLNERIEKAEAEMKFEKEYDVVLINDDLETALKESEKLIKSFIE